MKKTDRIEELILHYPKLLVCAPQLCAALQILIECYRHGGKLLVCGNGGSASDALHIVGELMKGFSLKRSLKADEREKIRHTCADADYLCQNLQGALPAIALVGEVALQTAFSNDVAPDLTFAQQVYGYGLTGDVLLAISTSGNSRNVVYACEVARLRGMKTVSLTGEGGGKLKALSDVTIAVPETETYRVQELHLPVYHALCLGVEDAFFGNGTEQ